jgi:hypothetical protein
MNYHFECQTFSGNPLVNPLVFDWDDQAGRVSGASAEEILRHVGNGGIPMHPMPAHHVFSAAPLKSHADMAAIIGYLHQLPAELQADYPALIEGEVDPDYVGGFQTFPDDPANPLIVDLTSAVDY